MTYFRFFPDVIWIKGRVRSTLYELSDRKVTHLSAADTAILFSFAERSIEETKEFFPSEDVDKLLEQMIANAIGSVYNGAVYAEPYLPHMPFELKGYMEPVLKIDELTLELYPQDVYGVLENKPLLIFQGCNSCIPSVEQKRDQEEVSAEMLSQLAELDEISITNVRLNIGAPTGHYDVFRQLIDRCAHGEDIGVEFVTYLKEISGEFIKFAAEYENSTIVICCSDAECQSELESIKKISTEALEHGVRTVLSVIYLHNTSENTHSAVSEAAASLGVQLRTTELLRSAKDHVLSIGRGEDRLEPADGSVFYAKGKYSTCKYGKLSINCNGVISGCLHDKAAYPQEGGLFDFLVKEGHKRAWEMPKRMSAVCRECENRFACVDCTTIEQALYENPEYISMICGYNTHTGEWC
ncbi:hypothetical protein [Ruminococcus flavefaciens]|uniref:hypothetical protein n=1 Tax=Ruminococcus flavefaciens TaxID=1265 RepID=UPI00048F5957|nr:hypothetical protein [Ruminococcus flavefaciens]